MSPKPRQAIGEYWRGLESAAVNSDGIAALASAAPHLPRRRLLQLMAASLALGGLGGCGPEPERRNLLPYVEVPPGIVPGQPQLFATAMTEGGYGTGLLVRHQMGRPVKIEGNPDHPASRGAASAIHQASILTMYDPLRAQSIVSAGQLATWEAFVAAAQTWRGNSGEGLRLLTGPITSPTLIAQIAALTTTLPAARWHQWEPYDRDNERAATAVAFGRPLDLVLDFAPADVVFAVESDALSSRPGHLAYARDFAARRRIADAQGQMSRVYAIESTPTLLGAKADHRLALAPAEIERALRVLAGSVAAGPSEWIQIDTPHAAWLKAAAADLLAARGRSLIVLGPEQPRELHLIGHAINAALGNFGATVRPIELVAPEAPGIAELAAEMHAGKVETLMMLGVNPVYAAPADFDFAAALKRVPRSVALSLYRDESAVAATWHLPAAHEYEAWSDTRGFDGTATIMQPQVRPLYGGHSAHQLLAALLGTTEPHEDALVRAQWQRTGGVDFEAFWRDTLRAGVVENSAAATVAATPKIELGGLSAPLSVAPASVTLLFRPEEPIGAGLDTDNPWLLELPRPFTRLTWDNAAILAPVTANRLRVKDEDVVTIEVDKRKIDAPVFVLPGQTAECITLPLGFGRSAGGLAVGVGFDAYRLRTSQALFAETASSVTRTGRTERLATVQHHDRMAGRDLIRSGTAAQYARDPDFLGHTEATGSLYPAVAYPGEAWAMSIDLASCIGCQACVVACQAENNGPIVGKEQVLAGREMHWLRIDRYFTGATDTPTIAFQPVPCMHCEEAPCEVVCPVEATVHDHQGLNAMVYNRCVGTRFCSNNCPYKVRRFNFYAYAEQQDRPAPSWNPDVTVRDRGVMEKCTYCVQRVRAAQIAADREDRRVRDGEIVTACQQSCPTQAIVFGDRNDKTSAVAQRKASPLDYVLLADLNTRPRTSYQAILRNPNPAIPEDAT
ncbi:MAG: 4Fe-4S dicluster domain-containing protein [Alphaproteobacteria bacterium]|nr:4Fe-4S dicluster domain-containing protein [Alphaproteobacteria bacterium]